MSTWITDANGAVKCRYVYDLFGGRLDPETIEDQTWNNYLFTGQAYDRATGLVYLRARFYDPGMGRFTSRDSYGGSDDDPLSLHRYAYCRNNPINVVDPGGNDPVSSDFIWGKQVHDQISKDFKNSQLMAQRVTDWPMPKILGVPWIPGLTAGRPDLVQFPTSGSSGEVYEIKPISEAVTGKVQLLWYLTVLNYADPMCRKWQAGSMSTYMPPKMIQLSPYAVAVISPPLHGLILYQVQDNLIDAVEACMALAGIAITADTAGLELNVGSACVFATMGAY
ncbi:MAG: RHS repeat-associated core domain-containing protein [Armatimonadota bacterium]